MPALYLLILLPLLGAVLSLFGLAPRKVSLLASLATLGLALVLLLGYKPGLADPLSAPSASQFQYVADLPVVPSIGLGLKVGADGLGLMMVVLAGLVSLCAVQVAPAERENDGPYFACLLFITAGCVGAFVSLDLFFFYAFHELALIPTFLLIGIWGHGERVAAAWKITIYLALGSFILLIGLLWLYLSFPVEVRTFDLLKLYQFAERGALEGAPQREIFLVLLAGFGVLISLFPFHTWAPQGYAAAPTPAAMLHAGVLKKFGLFGLLRVAYPLLPEGAQAATGVLVVLLVGNLLWVGLAAIAQRNLDSLLGYSSVMHMGYAFLGLASLSPIGQSGTALLLFAHGLSVAALFAIMGEVRDRTGTTRLDELGGLAQRMPFLSVCFGFAMFASIGLPGFANFVAELLVFFGAFGVEGIHIGKRMAGDGLWIRFSPVQVGVIAGLWGVVISAVYMLRAYRRVFWGVLPDSLREQTDPPLAARWPYALLIAGLMAVGFWPRLLLDVLKPGLGVQPAPTAQAGR